MNLALRLAGYEEFAMARPSVPFIADDIMETFGKPRSEEIFRPLGQMAQVGHVVYLTHHRHLCEIAAEVVPQTKIHEMVWWLKAEATELRRGVLLQTILTANLGEGSLATSGAGFGFSGLGRELGLAIANALANAMGATLTLQSPPPGRQDGFRACLGFKSALPDVEGQATAP